MKLHTPFALRPGLAGILMLVTCAASRGAVTINSSVLSSGGLFTYSYTVSNFGTTADLGFVNINVAPGITISGAAAPTGFLIVDDSGTGFISFLEDADPGTPQTFAPNSTSGAFSFTSTFGPAPATFDAQDVNGTNFSGPVASAPIPEPSAGLLLTATVLPFLFSRRRRTNG